MKQFECGCDLNQYILNILYRSYILTDHIISYTDIIYYIFINIYDIHFEPMFLNSI